MSPFFIEIAKRIKLQTREVSSFPPRIHCAKEIGTENVNKTVSFLVVCTEWGRSQNLPNILNFFDT